MSNALRISRPTEYIPGDATGNLKPDTGISRSRKPRLRVITNEGAQTKKRPRVQYAIVSVLGMAIIMLSQLLLSLALGEGAYELKSLKTQTVELNRQTADLSQKIEVLSSPQNLAVSAEKLGMVSANRPAFLNLTTGKVTAGVSNIGKGSSLLGATSVSNIALEKLGYSTIVTPDTHTPAVTTPVSQTPNQPHDPHSTEAIAGPKTN